MTAVTAAIPALPESVEPADWPVPGAAAVTTGTAVRPALWWSDRQVMAVVAVPDTPRLRPAPTGVMAATVVTAARSATAAPAGRAATEQ